MKKDVLLLKNDYVFKKIFGSEKYLDRTKEFLKTIITLPEEEYDVLKVIDPNLRAEKGNDKLPILDIMLKTKTGKIIDIELQIYSGKEFENRMFYYSCKMVTEQITEGNQYKLHDTINVIITDFTVIEDSCEYIHEFKMLKEGRQKPFTNLIKLYIIELNKLPEKADGLASYKWLKLIGAKNEMEMRTIAKGNTIMEKILDTIHELSQDENERMIYNARQKQMKNEQARLDYAKEEGEKIGEKIGKLEKQKEIVLKCLTRGMDIVEISDITGLSIDEIEEIQKNI